MKQLKLSLVIILLAVANAIAAANNTSIPDLSQGNQNTALLNNISAVISKINPELKIKKIEPAPVPGFHQVFAGNEILYLSQDLRYIFYGGLLDLKLDKKSWNITESLRNKQRRELMATVDPKDMISFKPKDKPKAIVTVFTDVNCGFCQKLHHDLPELLDLGIQINYLAFPVLGKDSHTKEQAIWCASDRATAITNAMNRQVISMDNQCTDASKIAQQFKLGQEIGVQGTPTIVFADGFLLASYVSPKDLLRYALAHTV